MNQGEGDDMDKLAERVVDRLIARLSDEKTADQVVAKWSAAIDKSIGRGVRRALWYLFLLLCLLSAVKFGLLEKVVTLVMK